MYWITENLGTASLSEAEYIEKLPDIKIEFVIDLIDGKQKNAGQFKSKVIHIEKLIKDGNKVVVICVGGISRSNAVCLAYLVKSGMSFYEAHDLVNMKVPIAKIHPKLLDFMRRLG